MDPARLRVAGLEEQLSRQRNSHLGRRKLPMRDKRRLPEEGGASREPRADGWERSEFPTSRNTWGKEPRKQHISAARPAAIYTVAVWALKTEV